MFCCGISPCCAKPVSSAVQAKFKFGTLHRVTNPRHRAHCDFVCPSSCLHCCQQLTHLSTHHKGSTLKDKSVTLLQCRLQKFATDLCLNAEGKIMGDVLKVLIIYPCWRRYKEKLHQCFSCCTILIPRRISEAATPLPFW